MKDVDRIRIRKVYTSCPGWPSGGSKEFSSQTQIYAIPCRLQLPINKWRSAGPDRSLYLLSITGLAALGGQYHSQSGTEFSASKRVTCLLPATQADSHAGSKVYIWNVFGSPSENETFRWTGLYRISRQLLPRVSTEVLFLLPAEYGNFWKTYGIPWNSAEFRGIFTVNFSRNSAEFRGIPYLFAYGIPQVTKWSRFQIPNSQDL